ncbi:hypothetical protein GCM10008986_09740 [Salinibacillus aidingensis]|uniref:Restriction endonuclease type IV Mrr domain-containing protein n=1 Tax=Salinibacillus aidingensis TaxID=237684 RepID=A0ABP3KW08_9BACI
MTKKDKKTISNTVASLFLLVSLFLYWIVFKSTNFYILLSLIIAAPVIERIIYSILPDKKSKKSSSGKKKGKNKKLNNISPNRLREDKYIICSGLEELSWREFERLCFLYFKAKGYKPKETKEGADGGVDLIIYNKHHEAEAIQIKHYIGSGNQITVSQIRELHSAKRNQGCVLSRFITTSGYTKDALRQADDYQMLCYELNWVKNNIVKWQNEKKGKAL